VRQSRVAAKERIRNILHEVSESSSLIIPRDEVVGVESSTLLDEADPGSNKTTPLSGIGKAGETTGEENEENSIGSTQDPRHNIGSFNGEQLFIEVESSKTLFDLRKEILDRRDTRGFPEDGNFFFLLGKNVISKKLEKRHLIDDILEKDIPVSLTSRSNLEEALCYVENAIELVTQSGTTTALTSPSKNTVAIKMPRIRHNMFNNVGGVRITCKCFKSRCLKLYCDCFQQSRVRFL
jgi:hypothetical protein